MPASIEAQAACFEKHYPSDQHFFYRMVTAAMRSVPSTVTKVNT
jgi:hypothetical protein